VCEIVKSFCWLCVSSRVAPKNLMDNASCVSIMVVEHRRSRTITSKVCHRIQFVALLRAGCHASTPMINSRGLEFGALWRGLCCLCFSATSLVRSFPFRLGFEMCSHPPDSHFFRTSSTSLKLSALLEPVPHREHSVELLLLLV
jgi:hypothetical protein